MGQELGLSVHRSELLKQRDAGRTAVRLRARYDQPQLVAHQQPLEPWRYWLGKLTRPGFVVADPYCGSGTVGVAAKECGGRSYIDGRAVRVARARIAATVEGSRAPAGER